MREPVLSIVAAGVNTPATLDPWVSAIEPQLNQHDVEAVLVCPHQDAASRQKTSQSFVVLTVPAGSLVPTMWATGLQHARGSIVAFTITACTPASDWVRSIVAAHAKPHAAIGGVIDHAPDAGL